MFFSDHQLNVFLKNNNFFKDSFHSHKLCSADEKSIQNHFSNFSFVKKSFVYVITETVAEYPYPYFSEKTWKAILFKMPFMIVGGKHSLNQLKLFGFKTFDDFWDESYDNLDHAADRVDKIVENLKTLSRLDNNHLDNIYKKMLPIIDYNQKHLEKFYQTQLDEITERLKNI